MTKRTALAIAVAAALAALPAPTPPEDAGARTYQLNQRHDGHLAGKGLRPPLRHLWTRDLGQPASYPIVAGGLLYAVTRKRSDGYGAVLHALAAASGKTRWTKVLGEEFPWGGIAYGGGRIYAVNAEGVMYAFAPRSGKTIWSVQLPDQWAFSSEPVFSDGLVFTAGAGFGGTVYAVDAASGALVWSEPLFSGGSSSSPAVSRRLVYETDGCPNVWALGRKSGELAWEYRPDCSGGGGRTPVLHRGRLYARGAPGPSYVFDASGGKKLGRFPDGPAPAFAGDVMVVVDEGRVRTRSVRTGAAGWAWTPRRKAAVVLPPVIVNRHVFVATEKGGVYALRLSNGRVAWHGSAGGPVRAHDDLAGLWPAPGFGVGGRVLAVPAGNLMTAFRLTREARRR